MSSSIKKLLAGVNIAEGHRKKVKELGSEFSFGQSSGFPSVPIQYLDSLSTPSVHDLKLEHVGPSNVSTGVLETCVLNREEFFPSPSIVIVCCLTILIKFGE